MADLNTSLFSAANNLRSKMDASESKNYLLGLIFYKYLFYKLLEKVVENAFDELPQSSSSGNRAICLRH
ncbi:hypothetical protein D3C76_1809720 [compost metagenome]